MHKEIDDMCIEDLIYRHQFSWPTISNNLTNMEGLPVPMLYQSSENELLPGPGRQPKENHISMVLGRMCFIFSIHP